MELPEHELPGKGQFAIQFRLPDGLVLDAAELEKIKEYTTKVGNYAAKLSTELGVQDKLAAGGLAAMAGGVMANHVAECGCLGRIDAIAAFLETYDATLEESHKNNFLNSLGGLFDPDSPINPGDDHE